MKILNKIIIPVLFFAAYPVVVNAGNCQTAGKLVYVGNTKGAAKSVWLSGTSGGEFYIDAANQEIDRWSRAEQGVHLTLSDNVSNGNGGTHKLYGDEGSKNCLLDTQNQKRGWTLPPGWRPPKPPVTGITPEMPMGVKPPIGTLPPPTGITPELPMGVKPPIGTLPPPTGITPELPMGVKPPIGTLPPNPPVTGITPELPMGVKPPIGTLPPNPPVTGITPEVPAQPPAQSGHASLASGASEAVAVPDELCPSDMDDQQDPSRMALCRRAPLTPGRDLLEETPWNAWIDTRYGYNRNGRSFAEKTIDSGTISFGADRLVSDNLAVGFMVANTHSETEDFWDYVTEDSTTVEAGPYVSLGLTPAWSLFGTVLVGPERTDHELVMFDGSSDAMLYTLALNAQGQYALGENSYVRPKLGINYLYKETDAYDLDGTLKGRKLKIGMDDTETDSGMMDAAVEFNWILQPKPDRTFVPFVELGVTHTYLESEEADSGFSFSEDDPRTLGSVRLGSRMLVGDHTQLDLNVGYNSIGVSDLDDWELQLFFSHAF